MIKSYDILKTQINKGGYKLKDMYDRINLQFVLGNLDQAQMFELFDMATGGASADAERPETMALILTIAEKVAALEARVAALDSNSGNGTDNTEQTEHPEWKPWDGISKDYEYGAVVSYNGELWKSVFAGQNVWQPGIVGTEALWQRVTDSD